MIFNPWNNAARALFLEQLESYLSAGLSLDHALTVISQSSRIRYRRAIDRIHQDIVSGSKLSLSLGRHVGMSMSLAGLIEHGQSSGTLIESIRSARTTIERQGDTFKKCVSALIYPLVIGLFSIVLVIGLIRGVMPQITPMLMSLHVPLPLLTRGVMAFTTYIMSYGLWTLLGVAVIAILFIFLYSRWRVARLYMQHALIRIPILGTNMFLYSLSVCVRSCGSLIDSGLPVHESYEKTVMTIGLLPLRFRLEQFISSVKTGRKLGEVFTLISTRIPAHVPPLILAGESSGTLGASLIRCADIIDRDLDHGIKRATSLIEPIMMAGMGGIVGSIALSIMMPIYDISKTLQH